jgi:D-aminopeptidase
MVIGEARAQAAHPDEMRPRARDIGITPGVLRPGALNAITDIGGVSVGHVTLIEGPDIRTGVTAILPHGGNLFQDKVPAGFAVGNGFGKFAGATQVDELGEIETPIVLTNTLAIAEGIAGLVEWTLQVPGNEQVRSVNAVVGETNDGYLSDIRAWRVTKADVIAAIRAASAGPVAEGCVGAGTGTRAFDWKGGIGTSSRILPKSMGGYTVGVLVQTNYGGVLRIAGAPVGQALGGYYLKEAEQEEAEQAYQSGGSIVVIIATDAPLSDRNLRRLARRAFIVVGNSGSSMGNGSGDYALAFSTAEAVRRTPPRRREAATIEELPNEKISPLFEAGGGDLQRNSAGHFDDRRRRSPPRGAPPRQAQGNPRSARHQRTDEVIVRESAARSRWRRRDGSGRTIPNLQNIPIRTEEGRRIRRASVAEPSICCCRPITARSSNPARRAGAERQAINAPLQGSAADIIKRAMVRIPAALARERLHARMLLQVHDELLFEAPEAEVEDTARVVKAVMEGACAPHCELSAVPLVVETGWAKSWDEAH